jgi:hypothetical protein
MYQPQGPCVSPPQSPFLACTQKGEILKPANGWVRIVAPRIPHQVDAVVFSAGIGENSSIIRALILGPLKVRAAPSVVRRVVVFTGD